MFKQTKQLSVCNKLKWSKSLDIAKEIYEQAACEGEERGK